VGGRALVTPAGRGTRPTSDRVREALFSTLESLRGPLAGARVLDLYAGSGAIGLEALSRGAAHVLFVERDPRALQALTANLSAIGLPGAEVRRAAVSRVLSSAAGRPYDVVVADPPYADPVAPMLGALVEGGWVADGGVVVVERATRGEHPVWPPGLEGVQARRYGDTTLHYARRR